MTDMNERIGRSGVTTEDLQRYFDDELGGAEARELAAQIEADAELKEELEQLGLLQGLVVEGLSARAAAVPEARFQQIWDEIDRTIERDARQAEGSTAPPSLWGRLVAVFKPWRIPAAAAAMGAAAVLFATNVGDGGTQTDDPTNKSPMVASEDADATQEAEASKASPPKAGEASTDRLAQATPEPAEAEGVGTPRAVEAEIHEVEFGGKNGRISRGGTVTVLYVEEDAEPQDSERSL